MGSCPWRVGAIHLAVIAYGLAIHVMRTRVRAIKGDRKELNMFIHGHTKHYGANRLDTLCVTVQRTRFGKGEVLGSSKCFTSQNKTSPPSPKVPKSRFRGV